MLIKKGSLCKKTGRRYRSKKAATAGSRPEIPVKTIKKGSLCEKAAGKI